MDSLHDCMHCQIGTLTAVPSSCFEFWRSRRGSNPQPLDSESSVLPYAPRNRIVVAHAGIEPAISGLEDPACPSRWAVNGAPGRTRTYICLIRNQETILWPTGAMVRLTGFEPALHCLKGSCPTLDDSRMVEMLGVEPRYHRSSPIGFLR